MHFKGGIGITALRITGKVGFSGHPMIDHFRFVKDNTTRVAKMTIPGPSMLHYRGGRKMMNMGVYPEMDAFYADVAAYKKAVKAFYEAGCRYLQLDDISFAYLCDPEQREMLRRRGDDPERQPDIYADGVEAGSRTSRRTSPSRCICRATSVPPSRRGGYELVAEPCSTPCRWTAISWMGHGPRRAVSSPAFLPRRKRPSCSGWSRRRPARLEKKDDIKRRIDEVAKFADLDQLCLSPQCGFASTEEGNILAEDEQWAKSHDRRGRRGGLGPCRPGTQEVRRSRGGRHDALDE